MYHHSYALECMQVWVDLDPFSDWKSCSPSTGSLYLMSSIR